MSTNLLPEKIPLSHFGCVAQFADYHLASYAIKGIGGSFMSSFLDLQLVEIGENSKLTVFAPVSWKYDPYFGVPAAAFTFGNNYIFEYLKHVIPCKLTWKDLMNLEEGTLFPTFIKDFKFTIKVTKDGNGLRMNGSPVIYPDLYSSDTLVIHGLQHNLDKWEVEEYLRHLKEKYDLH
ncbi:hypothetical protein FRX31_007890 [Thalictrum thalictroides]|uniref:Uncharacterized protein n=1 Tax=Thalictrum thalictroides TaxID=46969 RepID=A0A7J6WYM5_THATH|nr:hypothetical protein FRX31_007890 [Thalictrum thalictroides]